MATILQPLETKGQVADVRLLMDSGSLFPETQGSAEQSWASQEATMNGERVDSGRKGPTRSWQGIWAGVGGGPFATLATCHIETLLDPICPQDGTAEGA